MNIIKKYEMALQEIYDHVGFKEGWVVYPLDDKTDHFWNTDGEIVRFAETEEKFYSCDENYYQDDVYTQRFYEKHTYQGEKYTMIFCDPHTDGMKWFRIFDNTKKLSFISGAN